MAIRLVSSAPPKEGSYPLLIFTKFLKMISRIQRVTEPTRFCISYRVGLKNGCPRRDPRQNIASLDAVRKRWESVRKVGNVSLDLLFRALFATGAYMRDVGKVVAAV